ncbi:Pre-rRNA-processing protein TSR2 [Penicillium samsonianum]|uniref:Pre-rRNA-processing protein TSR2 n=1 Tax=Penicillium samsonianum TaxID=1882272 RepID=UPI00254807F8|nr:Pre-rRNA-processing protein TSR2 [Penicillium samsonianum]KAJ6124962.1 Pre-rRNA-processing protein TSR2 [Penicillium samsonianum]
MATTSTVPPATDAASYIDLAITLTLNNWSALSLAVDKRGWLCGAISDMLRDRPETDAKDLEEVLVTCQVNQQERKSKDGEGEREQVVNPRDLIAELSHMINDKFDVVVDDEGAADMIIELKA